VLQLRELDLQLAFAALRPLRKDVQNQRGAVEHPNAERLLQIALLRRRQRNVKDDEARIRGSRLTLQLFDLAGAYEIGWVRTIAPNAEQCRRLNIGRNDKLL